MREEESFGDWERRDEGGGVGIELGEEEPADEKEEREKGKRGPRDYGEVMHFGEFDDERPVGTDVCET